MNTETKSETLPLGICETCLAAFRIRRIQTADGGLVVGGLCSHNRTIAVRREFPDGTVGQWRMVTPADDEELTAWLYRIAGVADGIQEQQAERRRLLN